jgi:NAD(P)-dependent dehydrogenase (short-subunit alcohol dehydrogenase family)
VVIVSRSDRGAEIASELGARVFFARADITETAAVEAAIEHAAGLGTLRIVVNCAGVGNTTKIIGRDGPFPLDAFTDVVQTNLVGTFNVLRLVAARLSRADELDGERGVIVNTASAAAFEGQIGQAAYAASKGGIVSMTLPVARELARVKIRVVTIAPGLFHTPLFASFPQPAIDMLSRQVPHPARLGDPAEYAALAAHIVENPMINGETIRLDGAMRMAPR